MKKKVQQQVIRLERDGEDHLIPKGFFEILFQGLFPVLSLTYLSSILGIAANKGDLSRYLLHEKTAYEMSLFVALWVSMPAVVWIFLKSNPLLSHTADFWYRIISFLMVITITLSLFLFPEAQIYGLRIYLVLSIPVFVIIYLFFVKGWLPKAACYPLNALGFCALMYGALINVVF